VTGCAVGVQQTRQRHALCPFRQVLVPGRWNEIIRVAVRFPRLAIRFLLPPDHCRDPPGERRDGKNGNRLPPKLFERCHDISPSQEAAQAAHEARTRFRFPRTMPDAGGPMVRRKQSIGCAS
jgi:hypothetical protein